VITAWRITKARYAANAFDGEGARLAGGRWTSPGHPVVYTAENAALAALEILVHLDAAARPAYALIPCTFPRDIVLRLDRRRLPAAWRSYPAPAALQQLGDAWLKSGASAVLDVPSVMIDLQSNYLLNPRHSGFARVTIGAPGPFDFDPRLLNE
jgi:RES domain-containing protein